MKVVPFSQAWWSDPVILTHRRQRLEDCFLFEFALGYLVETLFLTTKGSSLFDSFTWWAFHLTVYKSTSFQILP